MKAIIPVAGVGSRLRPHTHTQPKSLIPVAGKPILAHIVDGLIEEGFEEFIFVIGYLGDKIERYISKFYPNIKSFFVVQTKGLGTAHAIWLTKDLIVDHEPIFIVFGDTIVKTDIKNILNTPHSCLGLKKVDDPRQFGVAEIDENQTITKLIEKPNIPKSNLALVGVYKIMETKVFKEALDYIITKDMVNNEEYHLTNVLSRMIEKNIKIKGFIVDSWFDCGKKDILLQTNALLLKGIKSKNAYSGTNILIQPVFIGENCEIQHSIIGPNVSIGDGVILNYTIIKNSIIGPFSNIENANLENSVIGNDASLKGALLSLNLGDSTEINLG